MAWTAPRTWVTGELVTAALLNTHLKDNLNAIVPVGPDAFTGWTPTVTQGVSITRTITWARYMKIGRLVVAHFSLALQSPGTVANNIVLGGLPFTAASASSIQGSYKYFDAGTTVRAGHIVGASTTTCSFNYDGFGNQMGNGDFAVANGDALEGVILFESTT
jgi:hypothetical protein